MAEDDEARKRIFAKQKHEVQAKRSPIRHEVHPATLKERNPKGLRFFVAEDGKARRGFF